MAKQNPSWTGQQDAMLKRLQAKGLSATQIAVAMSDIRPGTGRNAVIGRLLRLGLHLLGRQGGEKEPARATPVRMPAFAQRPALPLPAKPPQDERQSKHLAVPACTPVSLFEAGWGQCRWPLNAADPIEAFRFCGGQTVGTTSWCAGHLRRVTA